MSVVIEKNTEPPPCRDTHGNARDVLLRVAERTRKTRLAIEEMNKKPPHLLCRLFGLRFDTWD